MAKIWLKFQCSNCNKENWIFENLDELIKKRVLIYCCKCGHLYGHAESSNRIDIRSSWLVCTPFKGFERKHTRGPLGPEETMTGETRWGTADASGPVQGLPRDAYMAEYGIDPWTDWCSRNPDKKICQDNGQGISYKDRCKSQRPIKECECCPPIDIPETYSPRNIDSTSENKIKSDEPKKMVRYPWLECPDKIILNERFSLFVQFMMKSLRPDAKAIIIDDNGLPDQLPELEVVLSARGFDLEGSNTRILKIARDSDSDERFVLIPRELGELQIRVDFYQYGRRIGTERHNVLVTEKPTTIEVKQSNTSPGLDLRFTPIVPPPDLELYIEADGDNSDNGCVLYFRLHSESAGYNHAKFGQVILRGSPRQKMEAYYEEMSRFASKPETDAERRIAAIGNDLWKNLIPEELKREYWRFKDKVKTLLITSDEPWIPWEAIKPYRYNDETDARDDEDFWCQKFILSRWLSGPGTEHEIPAGEARPVAPAQVSLAAVLDEVIFIEQLGNLNSRIQGRASLSDKTQVLDLMDKGKFSVLHFAAHGGFEPDQPDNSPIMLSGGPLKPSDIHARFGGLRPRPLIFLNACKGAQMDIGFTGLGGWADRLVNEAKVGAFAGAMWSIHDALALKFAKCFYKALLQRNHTIAEAFRIVREEIRKENPSNSTWLAYVLYADPEGRVKS